MNCTDALVHLEFKEKKETKFFNDFLVPGKVYKVYSNMTIGIQIESMHRAFNRH